MNITSHNNVIDAYINGGNAEHILFMDAEEYETSERTTPERALICAVITNAIQDACQKLTTSVLKSPYDCIDILKNRKDARRWLTRKNKDFDDVRVFLRLLDMDTEKFYRNIKKLLREYDAENPCNYKISDFRKKPIRQYNHRENNQKPNFRMVYI